LPRFLRQTESKDLHFGMLACVSEFPKHCATKSGKPRFHLRQAVFARRKKAQTDSVRAFLVEPLARRDDSTR
jgi:hypothetical protein